MVRTFRYRLTPTRSQATALLNALGVLCELYNAALQQRREAWKRASRHISLNEQMAELKGVREVREDCAGLLVDLLRDPLKRLDRSFRGFFRRVKKGEKPGYPRYRARARYRTLAYPAGRRTRWIGAGGKRLTLPGIGNIRIRMHRPMEGVLREVRVSLDGDGHWYAALVCSEVPPKPLPPRGESVGLDLGITALATLSTGERVENPRATERFARALAKAQRTQARRKKGSVRRRKARAHVARLTAKISRVRRDHHNKAALSLVRRFDWIAVESLNVRGLASGMLAKHVRDAGWAQFLTVLASKAECAGREIVPVEPRGTSQECSGCGVVVRKTLATRTHQCACGAVLDRDHNAALVVHGRGHRLRGEPGIEPA